MFCLCFRYLHIIVIFWSFLAGVVTFYCSLGPETLLPNILITIKPKKKVHLKKVFCPLYSEEVSIQTLFIYVFFIYLTYAFICTTPVPIIFFKFTHTMSFDFDKYEQKICIRNICQKRHLYGKEHCWESTNGNLWNDLTRAA